MRMYIANENMLPNEIPNNCEIALPIKLRNFLDIAKEENLLLDNEKIVWKHINNLRFSGKIIRNKKGIQMLILPSKAEVKRRIEQQYIDFYSKAYEKGLIKVAQ